MLVPPATAAPFTDIFFFGDSLSDAGNVGNLTLGIYVLSTQQWQFW